MKKGVKGHQQLEDLVNPASQLVKQVKSGDKLEAAKTATKQAGKAVGGEQGQKLEKNMGDLINFTDAVEKKDTNKALNTAASTFVDPSVTKELQAQIKAKAGKENVDKAE